MEMFFPHLKILSYNGSHKEHCIERPETSSLRQENKKQGLKVNLVLLLKTASLGKKNQQACEISECKKTAQGARLS